MILGRLCSDDMCVENGCETTSLKVYSRATDTREYTLRDVVPWPFSTCIASRMAGVRRLTASVAGMSRRGLSRAVSRPPLSRVMCMFSCVDHCHETSSHGRSRRAFVKVYSRPARVIGGLAARPRRPPALSVDSRRAGRRKCKTPRLVITAYIRPRRGAQCRRCTCGSTTRSTTRPAS